MYNLVGLVPLNICSVHDVITSPSLIIIRNFCLSIVHSLCFLSILSTEGFWEDQELSYIKTNKDRKEKFRVMEQINNSFVNYMPNGTKSVMYTDK